MSRYSRRALSTLLPTALEAEGEGASDASAAADGCDVVMCAAVAWWSRWSSSRPAISPRHHTMAARATDLASVNEGEKNTSLVLSRGETTDLSRSANVCAALAITPSCAPAEEQQQEGEANVQQDRQSEARACDDGDDDDECDGGWLAGERPIRSRRTKRETTTTTKREIARTTRNK